MFLKCNRVLILFLLITVVKSLTGQMIKGLIKDEESLTPISFAHVLVEGTHYGTVSNQAGEFELNCGELKAHFSLVITSIGFKTRIIDIDKTSLSKVYNFTLRSNTTLLQEVEVSFLLPESILRQFHIHYPENYCSENTLSKAFYRTTFKENGQFVNFLEATVDVHDLQTKKKRAITAEITQQRKSNDYRKEKWNESGNYLHQTLDSDPIRNRSDFLDKKNEKYYNIKRLDNSTYNNELVYVISMTPKESVKKPLYSAIVYIKEADYALIKAVYRYDNKDLKIRNLSYDRKNIHTSFASGSIAYQKIGSWYFPKYLTGNTGFEIIDKITRDTLSKNVLNNEILFTNYQKTEDSPIANPVKKWGDVYKNPFVYDPEYWNKQVKISPSSLFTKAIADLEMHQPIEIQYFNNSANQLQQQTFDKTVFGRLDSVLTVYHLTDLFNGTALVTSDDSIILNKAYGYASISQKKTSTTSTLFDIGSITKQFTAAIILKMAEDGKLKLTDKVSQYLPDYRHGENISIHNLLGHTSGIPTFDWENNDYSSAWFNKSIYTGTFIAEYCSDNLEFEPGTKMEYSNSNYLLLSSIIEGLIGKDYYQVLQEMILDPLGMEETYPPNKLPDNKVAEGYIFNNGYLPEPVWRKSNMKGVGCLYSTTGDLLKWINALNSTQLLNASSIELMKSPLSYYEYYEADFGYSWAISRTTFSSKCKIYFYGGTSLGFYSFIANIPDKEITIILLNNKGNFPRIQLTNDLINTIEKEKTE